MIGWGRPQPHVSLSLINYTHSDVISPKWLSREVDISLLHQAQTLLDVCFDFLGQHASIH